VLGEIEYPEFDNLAEAGREIGEEKALELLNVQVKTSLMNTYRQSKLGKPSKAKLMEEAFALITKDEFEKVQGDAVRMQNLLAAKVAILKEQKGIVDEPKPAGSEEE